MRVLLCFLTFAALASAGDPVPSTVKVEQAKDGKVFSGSGTVVRSEGGASWVLTNRHVVPSDAGPCHIYSQGRKIRAYWCGIASEGDLALLVVAETLPAASIAEREPPLRSILRQFGFPGGNGQVPKQGPALGQLDNATAEFEGRPDGAVYYAGWASESGDSGSGVFDQDGQLVAVTWGGTERANCVSLPTIRKFFRECFLDR